MMSTTTGNRSTPLWRILLISIALQAIGLGVFYAVPALRVRHLTVKEQDAEQAAREAERRLRELEERRDAERRHVELKPDDAEQLNRQAERQRIKEILPRLEDMKEIRDALEENERIAMDALAGRTLEDVSADFYYRIHPLATQLVLHAVNQSAELQLPAAPEADRTARALLASIERDRTELLREDRFENLIRLHTSLRSVQHHVIQQLDEAQQAYPHDRERINRENHIEYLVNLQRDRIGELLGRTGAMDPATMNQPPADYEAPAPLPDNRDEQLAGMSIPELHHEARRLLEDIESLYRGSRAAERAMARNQSMSEALESMTLPGPATSFSGDGLPGGPPGTVGELKQRTAALDRAVSDINRMWQTAHNMGRAAGSARTSAGSGAAASSGAGSASRAAGAASAARGNGGRFADMTGFMYHSGYGEKGYASGHGGGIDITDLVQRSGYADRGSGGMPGANPPLLSEERVLAQALPGRKFSRESDRTGWLYIDTWYVIGPWENNSRIGHDTSRPPETLVDLDAEYTGKNGKTLRWQFHQSDNIRIKPPDEQEGSTYYAYTEVYFEEETELLVAVASDDAAKIWLNDLLIWEDSGLGPWRLDEGFRKVVFREGFNDILLRIENGPITCTFSVLLCPPDVLAAR